MPILITVLEIKAQRMPLDLSASALIVLPYPISVFVVLHIWAITGLMGFTPILRMFMFDLSHDLELNFKPCKAIFFLFRQSREKVAVTTIPDSTVKRTHPGTLMLQAIKLR